MKIDLTWIEDGLFTTFIVNSNSGMDAYKEIIRQQGAPKVLNAHRDSTIAQLKAAGYKVRKSTAKPKPFGEGDKALLNKLMA